MEKIYGIHKEPIRSKILVQGFQDTARNPKARVN